MRRASLFLVVPPHLGLLEGFSNSLVSLANYVQLYETKVEVHLVDLGLTPLDQLTPEVRRALSLAEGLCFVGVTTTTATYQNTLAVARAFKMVNPEVVVILGGHHAAVQDNLVLDHTGKVDIVVRGEGEVPLLTLLRSYPDLSNVPGISYLEDGVICRTSSPPLLPAGELDKIACTFRGNGLRCAPGKFDHVTYVSARGCPLRCAFCSVANQPIRAKSVPMVAEDLRYLVGRLGHHSIAIEDNFFAHSPRRTMELCAALEELQRELSFTWDCQTRVESLRNPNILRSMERAGCEAVYLGVEAVTAHSLQYLKKTPTPVRYLALLENRVLPSILCSTIDCYINLQLGIPRETEQDRTETISFLRRLGLQAQAHGKLITIFPQLHVIYPGTSHFAEAVRGHRYGTNSASVFERFTAWEAEQQPVLHWLGEHFAHGVGGIPEAILVREYLCEQRFTVDPSGVLQVANMLTELEALPGIRVFRYGRYLAGKDWPDDMPEGPALDAYL